MSLDRDANDTDSTVTSDILVPLDSDKNPIKYLWLGAQVAGYKLLHCDTYAHIGPTVLV